VGAGTLKILGRHVFSKLCRCCSIAKKNDTPPNAHRCLQNYKNSSKSMESNAAVAMVVGVFQSGLACVKAVVGDEDSTTRTALKNSYQDIVDKNI
jgi:hypothetical protein